MRTSTHQPHMIVFTSTAANRDERTPPALSPWERWWRPERRLGAPQLACLQSQTKLLRSHKLLLSPSVWLLCRRWISERTRPSEVSDGAILPDKKTIICMNQAACAFANMSAVPVFSKQRTMLMNSLFTRIRKSFYYFYLRPLVCCTSPVSGERSRRSVSLGAMWRNKTGVNTKARWIQACAAISDLYRAPNPSLAPPLSLEITRSIKSCALTWVLDYWYKIWIINSEK